MSASVSLPVVRRSHRQIWQAGSLNAEKGDVAAAEVGGFGFHCLAFASDCRRAALIALGSTVELVLRKPPFLAPRRTSRL